MASNLNSPNPASSGQHTKAALKARQSAARLADANASTRPNQSTLAEIVAKFRR